LTNTHNAIAMIETSSLARGIEAADVILKTAEVELIINRTICPGKYMVIFGGLVAAASASLDAARSQCGHNLVDNFIIPNVHPDIFPALSGVTQVPDLAALGIIEGFSVAAVIEAADAAAKAASIQLIEIHAAMAIGGKGFVTLTGEVAAVEAAVEAGAAMVEQRGLLVDKIVIPSPRPVIIRNYI
jgi:microcompartment protein CcmL/EutN